MNGLEFDYLIVGAGSAGCGLAARLSEDPGVRVALSEAGDPDNAPEISMPVAFPQLFKTKYDWDFASEPEHGLWGRRIHLPKEAGMVPPQRRNRELLAAAGLTYLLPNARQRDYCREWDS